MRCRGSTWWSSARPPSARLRRRTDPPITSPVVKSAARSRMRMMMTLRPVVLPAAVLLALCACSSDGPPPDDSTVARSPAAAASTGYGPGVGPSPALPAPARQLVPTVQIAPGGGASTEGRSRPGPAGHAFAGRDNPRTLVSPTATCCGPKPSAPRTGGLRNGPWRRVKACRAGVPSANRLSFARCAAMACGNAHGLLEGCRIIRMAWLGNAVRAMRGGSRCRHDAPTGSTAPGQGGDFPAPDQPPMDKEMVASVRAPAVRRRGSNSNVAERGMDADNRARGRITGQRHTAAVRRRPGTHRPGAGGPCGRW